MKISTARSSLGCVALLGVLASALPSAYADAPITLDPGLKGYIKVSGVSGNLNSIGSDTLNNLMTLWPKDFASSTRMSKFRSKERDRAPRLRP